jgi:hypothetical protein
MHPLRCNELEKQREGFLKNKMVLKGTFNSFSRTVSLEEVQEKAVKMVTGLKGTTYEERCLELGLETLQRRRERQDMAMVHK